jgi:hypothetical protein
MSLIANVSFSTPWPATATAAAPWLAAAAKSDRWVEAAGWPLPPLGEDAVKGLAEESAAIEFRGSSIVSIGPAG